MSKLPATPFETILQRTRPDEEDTAASRTPVLPWYIPQFRESGREAAAGDGARNGYAEEEPLEAGPRPVPRSIDADAILLELALAGCPDIEALVDRRRRFARDNHPDTLPAELRENATQRMMIANGLIDAEIARRRHA